MDKLVRIEHEEKGVWYFNSYNQAARFIGCTLVAVRSTYLGHIKKVKGWSVDLVEDDGSILRYFINPNDVTAQSELKETIRNLEQAIAIMREWEIRNLSR